MVCLFANGKGVRFPVSVYQTKAPRRKLTSTYSDASPVVYVGVEKEKHPFDLMIVTDASRAIAVRTSLIPKKTTRTSSGVQIITLKKGQTVSDAYPVSDEALLKGYRKLKIPAPGIPLGEKNK